MGTPQYMAPEQIEHPLQVDHRADIYSLGVVFYQMLTGELPLGRFAPPSTKVQIDVRLDEVVLRALEKEPARRYQQASELKSRVETIATSPLPAAGDGSEPQHPGAPRPSAGGAGGMPASHAPGDAAIEHARLQVQGPAIGLLVTGILNWLAVPLVVLAVLFYSLRAALRDGVGEPPIQQGVFSGILLLVAIALVPAVLSTLMIVGALKTRRLRAYGLAILVSILAIISPPACLVGLPIGIWALVVLSQRDVRAAFAETRLIARRRSPLPAAGGGPSAWPRFSRLAIAGAVWAPIFFLMVPGYFLGSFSVPSAGPEPLPVPPLQQQVLNTIAILLAVVASASAVTAPLGTTILGAVSISQIRHSAGRLYGLGLALFDAMLFPLLILDSVIVVATGIALAFLLRTAHIFIDPGEPGSLLIIVPVVLLALGIDYPIVRWAWRAINRPVGASPRGHAAPATGRPAPSAADRPPPNGTGVAFAWIALGLFMAGLLGGAALATLKAEAGMTFFLSCECLALVFGILGRRHRAGRVALIGLVVLFVWCLIQYVIFLTMRYEAFSKHEFQHSSHVTHGSHVTTTARGTWRVQWGEQGGIVRYIAFVKDGTHEPRELISVSVRPPEPTITLAVSEDRAEPLPSSANVFELIDGRFRQQWVDVSVDQARQFCDSKQVEYTIDSLNAYLKQPVGVAQSQASSPPPASEPHDQPTPSNSVYPELVRETREKFAAQAIKELAEKGPDAARLGGAEGPTVVVTAKYPGASAEVIADTVAVPIEQQINGVEWMLRLESESRNDGTYTAWVRFKSRADPKVALTLVKNRVALAQPMLPEAVQHAGVAVEAKATEKTANRVTITLVDRGQVGGDALRKFSEAVLKRLSADGAIVRPESFPGPEEKQAHVQIDRAKCREFGVPLAEVTKAVDAARGRSSDELKSLDVCPAKGNPVPLGKLVTTELVSGPTAVYRVDMYRAVRITGSPPAGKTAKSAAAGCVELADAERNAQDHPAGFAVMSGF
jgi:hypothetical protein